MRIVILTNAFPPDGRGGAERVAYAQADGFGVMGHEVKVFAATDAGAWTSGSIHGMEVERFPSLFSRLSEMSPVRRLAYHLFADAGARRDVVSLIIEWKPDVLLTHNLTGCGIGTARLVQSSGISWVHTLHDIQLTDPSGRETVAFAQTVLARVWRAFWSAWRRRSFGQPDVVVSPTRWLLEWHRRHGFLGRAAPHAPRNAVAWSSGRAQSAPTEAVIPNPAALSAPRGQTPRRPATIAYVGRLSRDKGFDVFLDALERLDASVVCRAIAAGPFGYAQGRFGPMMEQAREMRDPRLELRGSLSPDDARRAIAEADVLVAPSRILENQQTILLEAMAEGTPVVASDTGGTRETLEGTGCPVIADADGQKIADAVRGILLDDARWSGLSRAMRERAKRHDPERYFSSLLGLLSG